MKRIVFIFSLVLSFVANAASNGTCGAFNEETQAYDDCHWSLDDDGHLKIWGTGKMRDYKSGGEEVAPWGKDFTSLEMDGITSIGAFAFYYAPNFSSVVVPSSVEQIGTGAFQGARNITSFDFEQGSQLKTIGSGSIHTLPNLHNIDIPEGVTQIYGNAFNGSGIENLVLPDSLFLTDEITDEFIYGLNERAMSNVKNVYCSEANQDKCVQYFEKARYYENGQYYPLKDKATLSIYTAEDDNRFYTNGKWYDSLSDIGKRNYIKKRIYTVDEANQVAGKTNSVKIRYR